MQKILVVEDEANIADSVLFALEEDGYQVQWVSFGYKAINLLADSIFDLVILDVGLPDMSGFDVCREVRKKSEIPVVFLTARADEIDRVVGLEIGGDDYLVKPFSLRELRARVKVILRRSQSQPYTGNSETIACGDKKQNQKETSEFDMDIASHRISYLGQCLTLTLAEFRLLQTLISQPGRVFSREQLLDAMGMSTDACYERSVDTHIKAVRAKLRAVSNIGHPIQTLRGVGYSYHPGK